MENKDNQQSFWQFSDELRLHSYSLANLSLNDSIWSNNYRSKRPDERRNFEIAKPCSDSNDGWNISNKYEYRQTLPNSVGVNGGFINNATISKPGYVNLSNNMNMNWNYSGKGEDGEAPKSGKKNSNKKRGDNDNDNKEAKSGVDKRFKTLPASESLPRNETIGGYIFVCNNDTMAENLKRQLFGLPPRYRDSVRAITPGLPLFLYNYSTHQLHGIFEAASFGGTNIDPTAWEDKKCHGESRFPAQVRVITRKICEPMEEDSFRPILHHYDGPKFRLELNVPEALSLLDIFAEQDTFKETVNAIPA